MGTKGSYDMWADLVGDDSYRYDEFLPYFMRHQNFTPPESSHRFANATPHYDDTVLGTDGKLEVIFPNYANAFGTWVEKGLAAIGLNPINGFQSGDLIGSSYSLATIEYQSNVRSSSETAFLRPELKKDAPNTMFYPNTLGKKVLFDDNKKATGVIVETDGFVYELSATREVILSAGAFQSPQLLMVSGIGPRDLLEEHDIDVLVDSPGVGQNMTDHVLFGSTYRVNVVTGSSLAYGDNMDIANQQFKEGTGPLVNPNVDMFGWEKLPRGSQNSTTNSSHGALPSNDTQILSDLEWFSPDWPEIEYIAPGGYFGYATNFAKGNPTDGYNYATIVSGMVATLSRGTVSISSADTNDLPIIDPNWLSHPADQAVAVAAFKRTREIWESDAMAELRIGEEYFPGKEDVSTDEEIWNFIQQSFSTIFHASCTCRMGKESDPTAVVDAKGRVFGVQGLRVVDASSMPLLPPGHPMATICKFSEHLNHEYLLTVLFRCSCGEDRRGHIVWRLLDLSQFILSTFSSTFLYYGRRHDWRVCIDIRG
jgi:choline dehydrogenase